MASFGLSSIKGTCLCAAAWKITSGFSIFKILSTLVLSLMEPINTLRFKFSYFLFNSFWISYAEFSYISNIMSFFGLNCDICLHSSEPIEPPPPL